LLKSLGNTLGEYALLFGLIALLSMAALRVLGSSIEDTLSFKSSATGTNKVNSYINSILGAPSTAMKEQVPVASSNSNAQTPMALTSFMINSSNSDTNATSVDGTTTQVAFNTIGLIGKLNTVIDTMNDPSALAWANEISRYVHYMAGAMGDEVGIESLTVQSVDSGIYRESSVMRDVYTYQQKINFLLQNIPPNTNPEQVKLVSLFATDAIRNAQPFIQELDPFIKNGVLDTNALASSPLSKGKMTETTYDETVSYETLQQTINKLLVAGDSSLNATLQDAHELKSK
jgi:hypothetical protein